MASKPETPAVAPPSKIGVLTLLRLGGWGFCAALALGVVATVSQTDRGIERLQTAFSSSSEPAKPAITDQLIAKARETDFETRRLTQQLQTLAADRDRLAARVATLERNFDDVTGSVKTVPTARITPSSSMAAPPVLSAPATVAAVASPPMPANDNKPSSPPQPPIRAAELPKIDSKPDNVVTGAVPKNIPVPAPRAAIVAPEKIPEAKIESKIESKIEDKPETKQAAVEPPKETPKDPAIAEPLGNKLEFGIDLGSANSIESLRALWLSTKAAHAPLLDSYQPSAILRPTGKNGAPQLRLMAGPFADAGAAAAICKTFALGRGTCRPFAFDGQKLPLR